MCQANPRDGRQGSIVIHRTLSGAPGAFSRILGASRENGIGSGRTSTAPKALRIQVAGRSTICLSATKDRISAISRRLCRRGRGTKQTTAGENSGRACARPLAGFKATAALGRANVVLYAQVIRRRPPASICMDKSSPLRNAFRPGNGPALSLIIRWSGGIIAASRPNTRNIYLSIIVSVR